MPIAESIVSRLSHLDALKEKHIILKQEIKQAQKSPSVTDLYLGRLKKQKLRVKEEIERLSS